MVGTLESAVAEIEMARRPSKPVSDDEPQLTEFDRLLMGKNGRIELPLDERKYYRRMADLIRGYASLLEFYGGETEIPQRHATIALKTEMAMLNSKIRKVTGKRTLGGRLPGGKNSSLKKY